MAITRSPNPLGPQRSEGLEGTSILQRSDREEEQRDGENTCGERVSGEDDGHRANAKELEMGLMRDSWKGDQHDCSWICSQR